MNDDLKRWLPWIGVAVVAIIVIAIIAINQGGDDDEVAADTTTTAAEETTTTSEAAEETTTTSEAAEETTTTEATAPAGGEPLKLASLLPLSGDLSAFGPGMEAGVRMAVEEANAAGGVHGADIAYTGADSATSPDPAKAEAAKIIAEGNQAMVGAAASGISLAVIDDVTASQVVMVSPSNTGVQFTTYDHGGFYYRTAPSDALQGGYTAQLMVDAGAPSGLAIVYREDSYGEGLRDTIIARYGEENVVAQVAYLPEGESDWNGLATQVADADPSAILCVCFPDTGGSFTRAAADAGLLDGDIQWFYTDGMLDPEFVQTQLIDEGYDNLVAGFYGTAPGAVEDDASTTFAANFLTFFGEEATLFAPQSYDGAWLLILAAQASDGTSTGIQAAMPPVSKGGEKCFGAACLELLLADPAADIDYVGASGEIDFLDDNSGDPGSAFYQIWQFNADGGTDTVGVTDNPDEIAGIVGG